MLEIHSWALKREFCPSFQTNLEPK